jgi:drug/metabolite transporter (DMT)-like permease
MTEWHDFWLALAVAGAAAAAVLAAVLQLGARHWRRTPLRRAAAVLALAQLLVPLVAALVALMPSADSWRVGYVVAGSAGICVLVWHTVLYLRHEATADAFDDRQRLLGLTLTLGGYFALVVFAVTGDGPAPYVVAALSVWLLVSGAVAGWVLVQTDPALIRD